MQDTAERLDALIRSGARRLTGFQRRSYMAEVATELCGGSARQAERRFGWGRGTVSAVIVVMSGPVCASLVRWSGP